MNVASYNELKKISSFRYLLNHFHMSYFFDPHSPSFAGQPVLTCKSVPIESTDGDTKGGFTTTCGLVSNGNQQSSKSDSSAVFWGIIFGLLFIVIIVAIIMHCCRQKREKVKINEQELILASAATTQDQQQAAAPQHAAKPAADPNPTNVVKTIRTSEQLEELKQLIKPLVAMVYADWCPHCRTFAPTFVATCNNLAKNGVDCEYVMIDGHNAKDVHSMADIQGYPFVLIMLEDGTAVQNQPPRDSEGLSNHITTALDQHVSAAAGRASIKGDPL